MNISNRYLTIGKIFACTILLFSLSLILSMPPTGVKAGHTVEPSTITVAGDLQDEAGCPADWDPACSETSLDYSAAGDVWQRTLTLPAGDWQYKAALNGGWEENYGQQAQPDGANIPLSLDAARAVTFYYDHKTHWITDNVNSVIATAPGNYQHHLGCSGDWQPDCLRSWLQDPDGDGIYSFVTSDLPAGNYEVKVAIDESWEENYGAGGERDGPNITFTVPRDNAPVTFRYDAATHILDVGAGGGQDNNVEYDGLGHDSRDRLYRVPFGAVTPGTEVTLRFRTYHDDVTGVRARFWDGAVERGFIREMNRVATDVSCYDSEPPDERCDYWQTTYTPDDLTTLYYRFIISDGDATAFYADDRQMDGSWGVATPEMVDNSYAITVYDPAFKPIPWMQNAVVYQLFPDRFRNGNPHNDPQPDEPRYGYPGGKDADLEQIIQKEWGALPEGHCRGYENPAEACTENPRGRDFYGGDLQGVIEKLDYLESLGVTAIYFNPIFDAASNHLYDGRDYRSLSPWFGTQADWERLVEEAKKRNIRLILDGVFNHLSSDSPYFDRYGHFETVGACESVDSPYRDWFLFQDVAPGTGPCVGSDGTPNAARYEAWFGFESLAVLNKHNQEVRDLVYGGDNNVAAHWLEQGAAGWRLDVMADASFPDDFWPAFRDVVKSTKSDAPIIGELWKKHEVLPRIHGRQADTIMDYRFRNAILGFFGTVDDKGFVDDGDAYQDPSLFARKLRSIREDYPDAVYYNALNIMGTHDTERILWSLTPGESNRAAKEFDEANLATGKRMLRLARVVQMTIPGTPMIYYGDEVGMTGEDDPDDRRAFPWVDHLARDGGQPHTAEAVEAYGAGGDRILLAHYRRLADLREKYPVFRNGELTFLLTDDAHRTMAYLLHTDGDAAIVAINPNAGAQRLTFDAGRHLPDDLRLRDVWGKAGTVEARDGTVSLELPAHSAAILVPAGKQDLVAPDAPANLSATAGNGEVTLAWESVDDAAAYNVYRSPVPGGGYRFIERTSATTLTDATVTNGKRYYYVVHAVDAAGNEGEISNEAAATPAYPIGYAVLQWPKDLTHTLSVTPTETIYGQVYVEGITDVGANPDQIVAQVGFGAPGSDPATWSTWVPMTHNSSCAFCGDNYEYQASLRPEVTGTFDLLVRFSTDAGLTWTYGGRDGPGADDPGRLQVEPNEDTTPPAAPGDLRVENWSKQSITIRWEAVSDAAEYWLYRYEGDGTFADTPLKKLPADSTVYTDRDVSTGNRYTYAVRAVDHALNRSALSNMVSQTAEPKTVDVTFRVRVPAETPEDATIYLPGSIDQLGPWNPARQPLTQVSDNIWEVKLQLPDGMELEYKYTRGSWEKVEWWGSIVGVANRHLAVDYGTDGTQLVDDTATDWGNGPDEEKAVRYWRDPLVSATTPAGGERVSALDGVTVEFSRAIQPDGEDFSNAIVVEDGNGATVAGTVSSTGSTTLRWVPDGTPAAGTYTVTVFNVRSDIDDSVPMQAPYRFTFTKQ